MNLQEYLKNLGGESVHFLDNQGNAGDGLIHAGFYRLAEQAGVSVETIRYPDDRRGKTLLIMGAGAFCRVSFHKVEELDYYSGRFERICVLPATFETAFKPVGDMLRQLPAHVSLFCRERISYDAVRAMVPAPEQVYLDHDMAFAIDTAPWGRPGCGTLTAFRTDDESKYKRVPSPNFDISNMGREYHQTLILDIVSHFDTICTDRLHVSIAGALLGKKVRLFEGSYHKIRGIFEYSLRERYPAVELCGDAEFKALIGAANSANARHVASRMVRSIPGSQSLLRALKVSRQNSAKKASEGV